MKKIYLISCLTLFLAHQLYSQTWTPLTSGTTLVLTSVSAPSYSVSYVTGYSGTILKTLNAGASWASQKSGTKANLFSILFTDINTGYAVGDSGIALTTSDGGTNWTPLNMPALPSGIVFRHIYFINDSIGFISGGIWQTGVYNGYIYKTTNKGASWVQCLSSPTAAWGAVYSIFFTSPLIGYALQASPNGLIWKTTDGGNTWNSTTTNSVDSPGQMFFTNASTGFFTSNAGDIYKTTDAGTSWDTIPKVTSNTLGGIDFVDANNGYVVGYNSTADTTTLLKTSDGGASWTQEILMPNTSASYYINFYKDSIGYIVGTNGSILKWSAPPPVVPSTWTKLTSGTTYNLFGVSAPSDSVAYACGYQGTILKTINAGTNWVTQNSGVVPGLYSTFFTSIDTGYVVGDSAAALKTTNGGATWTAMSIATSDNFRDVRFFNSNVGYITGGVGGYGHVFKTTDGGSTWTNVLTMSGGGGYSTYFTSLTTGYAYAGTTGLVYSTTDGGTTWDSVSSGANGVGILWFTTATNAVLVSNNGPLHESGDILTSSNAGASWSVATGGTSANFLSGVWFYDANHGYAVGGNVTADTATLLQTTNGGVDWNQVALPSGTSRLSKISLYENKVGYIVGFNGTILKWSLPPPVVPSTWTKLTSGTTNDLLGVSTPSSCMAYVCGNNGTILKTTNGGVTWVAQNSGTASELYSISFINADTGYAVGNNGAAVQTTNGGATWAPMSLNTTYSYRQIKFFNSNVGYIVGGISGGAGGNVFKTTDGGSTWTSVLTDPTKGFYSTYFTSLTVGYTNQGVTGLIYKTTDGGITWNSVSSGLNYAGQLWFTSPTNGVFVSNTGVTSSGGIVATTNAGATWSAVTGGTSPNFLTGIWFYDGNNGFIVGGNVSADTAALLQTTNGGTSWSQVDLPSGISRLYNVSFYKNEVGYIAGLNGTILKVSLVNNNCTCNVTSTVSLNIGNYANGTLPDVIFIGASGLPPYTFTYNINGGSTKTATTVESNDSVSLEVVPASTGTTTFTYKILQVEDAKGCINNQSDSIVFTINSILSVNELSANGNLSVSIFPNPCNNQIQVVTNTKSSVKITDIIGNIIYTGTLETGSTTIETSTLASGIYFITLTNGSGSVSKKMIKN